MIKIPDCYKEMPSEFQTYMCNNVSSCREGPFCDADAHECDLDKVILSE